MKIAVLYICTGKYSVFWENFYNSCQKYFLNNHERHYYVFTDAKAIKGEESDKVHRIEQAHLGWPGSTLYRFHMFRKIEAQFANFDFMIFFNANIYFFKK